MISRRRKYNNIITTFDGHKFDSKKEAKRYFELKLLQSAGKLHNLELQPKIPLMCNGVKIGTYIGDFRYLNEKGETIIEDVKSPATKTPVYNLKKRMLATQTPPVVIKEVF
jgi:hypothetical protein